MINIKTDSRKVVKGDIFVALRGISSDGHDYIDKAIELGTSKIVIEKDINVNSFEELKIYLKNKLSLNDDELQNYLTFMGCSIK